jgi:hypothetical protein
MMNSYSLNDIKKELQNTDPDRIHELCLRLARFKKENKELLSYLLFESHNEDAYVDSVRRYMDELFTEIPLGVNSYFIKKSLRKVLRVVNRQIKYSGIKMSELQIRIYFCAKMKEGRIPRADGTVLGNIYNQQKSKVIAIFEKLPEDFQTDFQREVKAL